MYFLIWCYIYLGYILNLNHLLKIEIKKEIKQNTKDYSINNYLIEEKKSLI